MTMQIRVVVCHQSEKFADGVRREALPSSRDGISNFEDEIAESVSLGKVAQHRSNLW